MSFSSRRRNYLLTPHRRDGLVEWMKQMLTHSFVLDCLEDTGADTFAHFEVLIEEHRIVQDDGSGRPSRLKHLVPTVGTFHTPLPLRQAYELYNQKHRLSKRKHIQISFNELRHILNLAQILAMRKVEVEIPSIVAENWLHGSIRSSSNAAITNSSGDSTANMTSDESETQSHHDTGDQTCLSNGQFNGPRMITFDGDQTLYSDGSNFDSNPRLASYLCQLLKHGVIVAIVTAAGYEYNVEKYEFRLSGLLNYFKAKKLTAEECERFMLFGGECNYLFHLGSDFHLHPVREYGRGGWLTSTKFLADSPANWNEDDITSLLDAAEAAITESIDDMQIRGRVIRKKRAVGLIPNFGRVITREALDETVLRCQAQLQMMNKGTGPQIPFCAFNGGRDVWVDVGNKRVAVEILGSYLGVDATETLHIGDQFLNTGNDYAARDICPCIWITSPDETTYILKTILRFAGANYVVDEDEKEEAKLILSGNIKPVSSTVDFGEVERRVQAVQEMDVFTGELIVK
ncbi:IMP-specific 5'-nucleotidase [Nitzschia inconspicua]|uniref:IMP-specific 5'-nucleotidase 1 n=1 Tax=Nitzschia inconspicua TaxID=303405 RepID=A0A9K3PLU6_9STRA|nr:IMP-specific 5'-nucleotidase [Nitzschia inconspicua]